MLQRRVSEAEVLAIIGTGRRVASPNTGNAYYFGRANDGRPVEVVVAERTRMRTVVTVKADP
jgi:hypothetical protein